MNIILKTRYQSAVILLLGLFFCVLVSDRTNAYVMPAEQLLYLMGKNFSGIQTLTLTQTTRLENLYDQSKEFVVNEKIWLKAPDFYRSEQIGGPEGQNMETLSIAGRKPGGDMAYRRLLMANDPGDIGSLLSCMGVDLEAVAFTRYKGVIAYRLGNENPESPKLIIEKETFLPVSFCYPSQTDPEPKMVTICFEDYQKVGKGWYPYEITYFAGEEVLERSVIFDLQVNTPVEKPLSEITVKRPLMPQQVEYPHDVQKEDERLNAIIERLRKKYQ